LLVRSKPIQQWGEYVLVDGCIWVKKTDEFTAGLAYTYVTRSPKTNVLVETVQRYGRQVAKVSLEFLEKRFTGIVIYYNNLVVDVLKMHVEA
jgi:hypothetical protein